jgi:hypothetical protein
MDKAMFERCFDSKYDELYKQDVQGKGNYRKEVEMFDNLSITYKPKAFQFLPEFINYRQDFVSSDREAAAYIHACLSCGILN